MKLMVSLIETRIRFILLLWSFVCDRVQFLQLYLRLFVTDRGI